MIFIKLLSLQLTFALSVKTPVCLAKDKQQDSRAGGPAQGLAQALGLCMHLVASNCESLICF